MAEQTEVQGLDYAKLWRTLLRLGIKQRFSQVRAEFFMKIATDGPVKYKGQEDKFYMNIADYGNTSAASIPIALDEMAESGILKEGMKLLCVAFGAGLTWNSVYMEW